MPYKYKHNREEINALLQNTLAEIGPEKLSGMRLVVLEKLIRSRYASQRLPGKTILREIINNFRSARWPETAPRLRS
jgi:hypothetical protein